jgi:ABC-2 type transport system ATP-binding protein
MGDFDQPVVATEGLTCRFGDLLAVDGLNLQVSHGSIFGLLGRNGAGKTTTIKMLITLLAPSSGSARIAGYDVVKEAKMVRRLIGYVPQMVSADGSLTARENLQVFARLYHIPPAERAKRIERALAFTELQSVADKLVREFSGGMVRRLEIVQSMLHRPPVLFLDEPTIGLDPAARQGVWEDVRSLIAAQGTTLVLTTHDMEEAAELCDDLVIMHRGRIVATGSPRVVAASLGSGATLDDAFIAFTGDVEENEEGGLRSVARTRRTAGRLG